MLGEPRLILPLAALIAGGVAGVTAPDWLEITQKPVWSTTPTYGRLPKPGQTGAWQRRSVLPHRGITHWLPIWIILAVLPGFWWPLQPSPAVLTGDWLSHAATGWTPGASASAILLGLWAGFVTGGWLHLLCDLPNPSGLPGLDPRSGRRRWSLRLWRSDSPINWYVAALLAVLGLLILARAWPALSALLSISTFPPHN